jgi:pimeloyl-ACP methyl ester carboxylesterase
MSAITIDNELVHYEVLGRGRPVILIHGWLGSWRYWIPVMQQLSANYRVYALDLWGFGDSQKNQARYSLQSQVNLLAQFMDKLGINKAALVGHSFGAAIAIAFARRHEGLTSRVMTVSAPLFAVNADALPVAPPASAVKKATGVIPVVVQGSPASSAAGSTVSVAVTPPSVPPLATSGIPSPIPPSASSTTNDETLRRNPFLDHPERLAQLGITPPTPPPNPLAGLMSNVKPKNLLERQLIRDDDTLSKLRDEVDKTDEAAVSESVRSFAGVNLALELCYLSMPVLLLHGKNDPFLPAPEDELLSRIGAGKTVGPFFPLVVPDFRHFPMLENTGKFNRLLMDFLDAKLTTDAQINLDLRETWRRQLR